MKISLITVTYNSARTIKDTIASVLSQTYHDIEYIIIDGASKDNTMEIIQTFDSSLIKVVSEPDKGIYDAINKGIKLATGEVVGILNSDDFFADSTVVERIVGEFTRDPLLSAVYSDVVFVEKTDTSNVVRYYSSKRFRLGMFKFGFQPAHPTFYAKRKLFEMYGYYRTDLKIAGDFELLLRFLLVKKIQFKYINDVWVKMRVGGASTSGISSVLKLNREIIHACKDNGVYTNVAMVYLKYSVKWWGFINKKAKQKQ